jgi:uncharacterized protein YjbI with pentapeptide repeats
VPDPATDAATDAGTAPELAADCSRCVGLCCVLLPFSASAGFGADKSGGEPCRHLTPDDRCGIHAELRERGWPGCTAFDCFGAGQQVSQVTYAGVSWRDHDDLGEMAAAFSVMRQLHEMLFHLEEVGQRAPSAEAATLRTGLVGLTAGTPIELLLLDVDEVRDRVGSLLRSVSRRVREDLADSDSRRADLSGRDLSQERLADADLRGAVLIAADLHGADLGTADLLGADLRDARLHGADLSRVLFLSQAQVNVAQGDGNTRLPARLTPPAHWH